MSVAFVDTETLGLDPDRNPIWEIAVIVDGVEHCWTQVIPLAPLVGVPDYPVWTPEGANKGFGIRIIEDGAREPVPMFGHYISRWVLENTGIQERYDHQTALWPSESIEKFATLVDGRHIVGAVPSFDEERLRRQYRDRGHALETQFPWHYHLIDVEALMVGYLLGRAENEGYIELDLPWRSDSLSLLVGIDPPRGSDRHSALGDARWAKAIYEKIMG